MSKDLTDSEICLSCQVCCSRIVTPMPWGNPADLLRMKEWYKARGCKKVMMILGTLWAVWDWKCPHLTKIGCDMYEKRPAVCREYDGRDDPLMKDICKLPDRKLIVLPGKGERA